MNNYDNIPNELKQLKQWIVWRYEDAGSKSTKVPYDATSGKLASVNDLASWIDFNTAVRISKEYSGIGFVFTNNDPYSFIDLDDASGNPIAQKRQIDIFREFDSYSEISPSGKGLHIIVKGSVPAGRRRSSIEIYSSQRYATFTGNIHGNKFVINERQGLLTQLWEQMGSGPATYIYGGDQQEKDTDANIITIASAATNGDKFKQLFSGAWQDNYQSQSEADFALIDIFAFYTQNRNQLSRLFHSSGLGKRAKANRSDYLAWMINKAFDRMLPPIDIEGFQNQLELKLAEGRKQAATTTPELPLAIEPIATPIDKAPTLPPGLLGEIAQFIYTAAPRPVPEIALAAAIGLMAGVCGRAYNVSGTGLNQYVLLLADTGTGKEAMASGIDKLMNAVRLTVPTSSGYIGPSEIASGQALIKHLNKTSQCFVSILGEFGLRLQSMSSQHANSAEIGLRRMLLDLYNKSGHGQVFRPAIYADRDKNVEGTASPAFSILGESTPERFYGALNEEMISEGLLPRFMLIEYNGIRPPLSKIIALEPPWQLTEKFGSLIANCEAVIYNKKVINVQADPQSQKMLDQFDEYATNLINNSDKDVYRQLWNRAHIKALKISATIAVGVNMFNPLIIPEYVEYAIAMVQSDIRALSIKFDAGMIGHSSSEQKQGTEIIRVMREYVVSDWERIVKYVDTKKLHAHKLIPYAYIQRRLVAASAFRNDRAGSTFAIKRAIQVLIDSDKIREISKKELAEKYNTTQRCFIISYIGLVL